MGSNEELSLLQEQLEGLAKAVAVDTNLPANMEDYLVTLKSLKTRIEAVHKMPDILIGGTQTGRMSSKTPNIANVPKSNRFLGSVGETGMTATPNKTKPPMPNRRAAIEHTRKLNETSNDS